MHAQSYEAIAIHHETQSLAAGRTQSMDRNAAIIVYFVGVGCMTFTLD